METSSEVYEWTRELINSKNPLLYSCYHDHKQEIDLYNKPFEAKIEAAKYFKNKGNELYKNDKFKKAGIMYTKGLLQLDYTFPQSESEIEIFDRLKDDLNSNSAMVAIKLESYQSAIHHCDQVLMNNRSNVKVLYRKGLALMGLSKDIEAKEIFMEALRIDPKNMEINEILNKL